MVPKSKIGSYLPLAAGGHAALCPLYNSDSNFKDQKQETRPRSRGAICPRFAGTVCPPRRGSRECRVHAAPAVSCAKNAQRSAHEHTGTVGTLRHSPRNGLTAYAVLSPATNSSCHRRPRIDGFARPGWADRNLRRFDTSNGCQDHTFLPYAATRIRQERLRRVLAPFVLRVG